MHDPLRRPLARKIIRVVFGVFLVLLIALSILYFRQHSLVYHPRRYDENYAYALPADGVEINYRVGAVKYAAYYLATGAKPVPKRIWLAFCGLMVPV